MIDDPEYKRMYALYREEMECRESWRDMEPHKRPGYAERCAEMADMLRKEAKENGS